MTVPIPQQPFSIGGRYQVLRKLGGGAMGAVFLAEDQQPNSHRQVAVKIPATSRHWRAEYVGRIRKEIGIMSALQHPNIVEILHSGEDPVYGPFIVMEYIKGISVRQFMAQQPGDKLTPDEAVRIAAAAADALAYAHTRPERIIHRDVKPDNILIREADRQVKVSDFGLAAVLAIKRAVTQWGTPDYIAPEQALGRGADERSDLYGLSATLYHMVTGLRPPPLGASAPQRPSSLMVPGVFDHTQARWLDSVILNLLAYDPNYRRPTRAAEVADVLRAILGLRPAPMIYPSPEDSAMIPALMQRMAQPRPDQRQRSPQAPRPQPAQPAPTPAAPAHPPARVPPSEQVPPGAMAPPPQAVAFPAPLLPQPPVSGMLPPVGANPAPAPVLPQPLPPAVQRPPPARPLPAQPLPTPAMQRPVLPVPPQAPLLAPPMAPARPASKRAGTTGAEFLAGAAAGLGGMVLFFFALARPLDAQKPLGVLLSGVIFWLTGAAAALLSPRGRRGRFPGWTALAALLVIFFGMAAGVVLSLLADNFDAVGQLFLSGLLAPAEVLLGMLAIWMVMALIGKE